MVVWTLLREVRKLQEKRLQDIIRLIGGDLILVLQELGHKYNQQMFQQGKVFLTQQN